MKFNDDAVNQMMQGIKDAIEESCRVVGAQHAGEPFGVVRAALESEIRSRFAPGTGPDDVMLNDLATQIANGATSVVVTLD